MELSGRVKNIIFKNTENGFTVFVLKNDDGNIVCNGTFENLKKNEYVILEGEYIIHKKYGRQFKTISMGTPDDILIYDLETYLGKGQFKGIGVVAAKKIVERFGTNAVTIIENEPDRLTEINGITEKKAYELSKQFQKNRLERDAIVFLQKYNVPVKKCMEIYKKYGEKVYEVIGKDPYRLTYDIEGIDFETAEKIENKVGIKAVESRLKAGIMYYLKNDLNNGNTYSIYEKLISDTTAWLDVDEKYIYMACDALIIEKKIMVINVADEKRVMLPELFFYEKEVAKTLLKLDSEKHIENDEYLFNIQAIERNTMISYSDTQKQAVYLAQKHGLLIIVGGAGSGKTVTIDLITKYFDELGKKIVLCAPTGRAAQRLVDLTGKEAKTIHRLLGISGMNDQKEYGFQFFKKENELLDADVIIIDEMSMVDIFIFYELCRVIKPGTRLILVGDIRQLPSVLAGNILRDLVESNCFTVLNLQSIFRQKTDNDIFSAIKMIEDKKMPNLNILSNEFSFLKAVETDDIKYLLIRECEKKAKFLNCKTTDIQVLVLERKGNWGAENMNIFLQSYFNPPNIEHKQISYNHLNTSYIFREGDKVMHIMNDYERKVYTGKLDDLIYNETGLFNGEVGVIVKIDPDKEELIVKYDDNRYVIYQKKDLDLLELAYVQTVHKSQGGEYPGCILFMLEDSRILSIELLYTAITRAKKSLTIIGQEQIIVNAMERNVKRYTSLVDQLNEEKLSLENR